MRSFICAFINSYKTDDTSTKIAVYVLIFSFITLLSDAHLISIQKIPFVDITFSNNISAISAVITLCLTIALLLVSIKTNVEYQREGTANAINETMDINYTIPSAREVRAILLASLQTLDNINATRARIEFGFLWLVPMALGIRVAIVHRAEILSIFQCLI